MIVIFVKVKLWQKTHSPVQNLKGSSSTSQSNPNPRLWMIQVHLKATCAPLLPSASFSLTSYRQYGILLKATGFQRSLAVFVTAITPSLCCLLGLCVVTALVTLSGYYLPLAETLSRIFINTKNRPFITASNFLTYPLETAQKWATNGNNNMVNA